MTRPTLITSLLVFSFLGLLDSLYLSYEAVTGGKLACSITGLDGCNTVAQSVYSHLFGIPLAVYGVIFYGILFILGLVVSRISKRFLYQILALLGAAGLIASIGFLSIQFFLIKALCIYCIGSAVVSLVVCYTTFMLWKRYMPARVVAIPRA